MFHLRGARFPFLPSQFDPHRFKSLSIQERINALSTTFPFFVSKLVEAHNELRETSVLSQFKRNLHAPSYAQGSFGAQGGGQYGAGDSS